MSGRLGSNLLQAVALTFAALPSCAFVESELPLDRAFVTTATIDGMPLSILLDTGSTHCLLSQRFVTGSGLDLARTGAVVTVDSTGSERVSDVARAENLRIGDVLFDPFELPVLALPAAFPADGLLGMSALGGFAWCFDVSSGELLILHPDRAAERLAARGLRVTATLPLGDDPHRPTVTVRVNDEVELPLLLDTGAARTTLPAEAIAALALPSGDALSRRQAEQRAAELRRSLAAQGLAVDVQVTSGDGRAVGIHDTPIETSYWHVRSLTLGALHASDLVVASTTRGGALGLDVLSAHPWLLHGPRRQLWLLEHVR